MKELYYLTKMREMDKELKFLKEKKWKFNIYIEQI